MKYNILLFITITQQQIQLFNNASCFNYVLQTKFGRHTMYCVCSVSYYYYGSQTKFGRHITFAQFLIITSPRDVLLFYLSFSLLLLLFFFHTFLSLRFLGDAFIKLYETLQEYHMQCEVVLLRVDLFKMAAVAMETAKLLNKLKTQK